tara:strand:- start:2001 stop:2126 length:126 start_codon:yes stop_codon:yes gene_type:complete
VWNRVLGLAVISDKPWIHLVQVHAVRAELTGADKKHKHQES